VGRSVSIIGPGRRYGVFSPSKGLFLGVSRGISTRRHPSRSRSRSRPRLPRLCKGRSAP